MNTTRSQHRPASRITYNASHQTYYTIRFLVDRERVADAYRAYAYFRWVDDTLDAHPSLSAVEVPARLAFLERQKSLLEKCYRGEVCAKVTPEEEMLIKLVRQDPSRNSGLHSYLYNMMQVMEFDARRRGRLISQSELNDYTRWLSTAVTEAMHYFIGHDRYAPRDETRYLAVTAAHITHMLRDTYDDVQAGYYNIPREVLESNHIRPFDIHSEAYCTWVQSRVQLARKHFQSGREYLARVQEPRCRLAGMAYMARFEWLLDTIEREAYSLRPDYTERKGLRAGFQMATSTLFSFARMPGPKKAPQPAVSASWREL